MGVHTIADDGYPPLPPNITSVQPGGGKCYSIELAWGRLRRWYLKKFRPGYVARMAALRKGDVTGAPHEILDPRDLKYCSNQCTAHWLPQDDSFRWRDKLPFTRWGLAELQIMGWPLVALLAVGLSLPFLLLRRRGWRIVVSDSSFHSPSFAKFVFLLIAIPAGHAICARNLFTRSCRSI